MSQLSEKELMALNDLLASEELLVKKFQMLSQQSQDPEVQSKFTEISNQHQGHFNALYSRLN